MEPFSNSRLQETPELAIPGAKAVRVDYLDRPGLVEHLRGVQVVLSFIVTMADPDNISQKNLIDACVEAGVTRFAPSEWATASRCGIPSYQGKDEVYEYLQLVNREKPVCGVLSRRWAHTWLMWCRCLNTHCFSLGCS